MSATTRLIGLIHSVLHTEIQFPVLVVLSDRQVLTVLAVLTTFRRHQIRHRVLSEAKLISLSGLASHGFHAATKTKPKESSGIARFALAGYRVWCGRRSCCQRSLWEEL